MNISDAMKNRRLYFDGGMGTELIARGLEAGKSSEEALFLHPQWVTDIHRAYIEAGANIIKTNTFGVNPLKQKNYEEYVRRGVALAREAMGDREDLFLALDIGPTGRMLAPFGDLSFEDAVEAFSGVVRAAADLPIDLILIETMNDSYETKAAVLAAKENSDLPVFVTNVYDSTCKTVTGSTPEVMATILEGLSVDAIGVNCSFGPEDMLKVVRRLVCTTDLPVIANPNAGLPRLSEGKTVFDESPEKFSEVMAEMAEIGVDILGGCCGTTPEHIRATVKRTNHIPLAPKQKKKEGAATSSQIKIILGKEPLLIGERINPTGKPKLKEALRNSNNSLILSEAIKQEEVGIYALDVNCGLLEVDEIAKIAELTVELSSVISVPLQIDSGNPKALEAALRIYNGTPLVNSVNGSEESMGAVLPLVKKYGGILVALTMDEGGIPSDAAGRVAIAERILHRANEYGISSERLVFDPLCLSISTDENSYKTTLSAVEKLHERGLYTTLGVSNISFGMPNREAINSAFFRMALGAGLSAAIMNPYSHDMMAAHRDFLSARNSDKALSRFRQEAEEAMVAAISEARSMAESGVSLLTRRENKKDGENITLSYAIVKGLRAEAGKIAGELLNHREPFEIINEEIIPALNKVGEAFDKKQVYLPSLLLSAEAAAEAFESVKSGIKKEKTNGNATEKGYAMTSDSTSKGRVLLATVKGDIHDIGKNIVRVVLESWGFDVLDLGRDVSCERILAALSSGGFDLVGLSALMTTTLPAMEEAVRAIRSTCPEVKIMVGGAVLTQEYADLIGADFYGADAPSAARIANAVVAQKPKNAPKM